MRYMMESKQIVRGAARGGACLLALMLLAGCATSGSKHQAYLEQLRAQNVKPEVYAKAEELKSLSLADIEHMLSQGVPEPSIVYHLRKTRATYRLTTDDVDRLRRAGASENLIDYLLRTPLEYRPAYWPYYPYGPYYYWGYPYPYPYGPYYYCPPYYPHGLRYHRLP